MESPRPPLAVGTSTPAGAVRNLAGDRVTLPREGRILFLPGAFLPLSARTCHALGMEDAVVVVPDAPAVARAWRAAERLTLELHCDDRPRGACAAEWGCCDLEEGWAFQVRDGVVVESRPIPGVPPGSWWPGVLGTVAWVLVAVGITRMADDGAQVAKAPSLPVSPPPAVAASAELPEAPAASAAGLNLELTTFDIPNLSMLADSGVALGFGQAVAGDGRPDGWHTNDRGGTVTVAPEAGGLRFSYAAATKIAFAAKPQTLNPGESVVVSLTLSPGEVRSHPAQVGVAFFRDREYLDQATRSVEAEFSGDVPLVLRATPPEGANRAQLRWNFETGGTEGSFAIRDFRFERLRATSTARFPLPRILLLTIETLRVDHTGLGGYARATTPNLDRLAAEGARFDKHYVHAPYTRPSLSALIASQYPQRLGVQDNVAMLPETAVTVAERFAEGGYVTSAFLAQFLLNQNFGFNQGFHSFISYKNDTPAEAPLDRLKSWLTDHRADNTFSWVHLFDPHGPYRPPASVADRFVGDPLWAADSAVVLEGKGKQRGKVVPDYVFDAGQTERRHYVSRYDADIFYADQQVGALVDWLRAESLDRSTLLVVTADHGESMTDHDKYFAHGTLWEHDIHVPMVVWAPGRVAPGTVVNGLTQHVDIVPTLLDYAGLSTEGTAGTSMRGGIEGGAAGRAFTVTNVAERGVAKVALIGPAGLKVVVSPDGQVLAAYDLVKDPEEAHDVHRARAAESEALAALYIAEGGALSAAPLAPVRDLSAQEKAQLEALGYAEGEGAP